MKKCRNENVHISCDNIAIAYLLWSLFCVLHSEGMNAGIMTWLETAALICAFISARSIPRKEWIHLGLAVAGISQAIYAICQQCGAAESGHEMFKITGFMGNPGQLGGFQAVSLISNLLLYRDHESRIRKTSIIVSSALILYSLILSDSRAGLLAAIGGIITITYKSWQELMKRHKWVWIIVPCLISISIWLIHLYRPESVSARILIWRVCADMFIDKPISGFGAYGFNNYYMLYQEEFLSSNPESMFTHMATDVAYPYNEFIHVLIEQGLVGFILLISLIFTAMKECHCQKHCAALIAFLIFSMFSYPSYKFALCVMLPLLSGILPSKPLGHSTNTNTAIALFSTITTILCILGISHYERKFKQSISDVYNNRPKALSDINTSFIQNHNNLEINARYATLAKHFPELISPDTIPLIFPSSESWCTIGNHFLLKKDYINAEEYFVQASRMTPSLIRPKYCLWETYLKQGREHDASQIAKEILHMHVKIENTYTLRVRNTVLDHYYTNPDN